MEWNQIEGNWRKLKGKIQAKWGSLTDSDLDRIQGKKDELAGKIQAKYGETKEEALREIDEWQRSLSR